MTMTIEPMTAADRASVHALLASHRLPLDGFDSFRNGFQARTGGDGSHAAFEIIEDGQQGRDETLVNESVIGTIFRGRVLSETKLDRFDAVIPEIAGDAYICGFANWIIDERDPLTYGFLVR